MPFVMDKFKSKKGASVSKEFALFNGVFFFFLDISDLPFALIVKELGLLKLTWQKRFDFRNS